MDLDTVIEDNFSDPASIDIISLQYNPMVDKHSEDLASSLYIADEVDAQSVDSSEADSQGEEVFDIHVSSNGSDNSEDEDDDTPLAGHWQNPRSSSQPVKPTTQPIKSLKRKTVPQPAMAAYYDRDTCSKLLCAVWYFLLTKRSSSV